MSAAFCPVLRRPDQECARQRRKLMATSTPDPQQHQHRSFLGDLSSELLAMIFEKLQDGDTREAFTARRLCRRFVQIATPIAYKTLILTDRKISHTAEQQFPGALEHMYAYTHHVVARSNLDPGATRRVLEKIRNLSSVTWRYVERRADPEHFWMPADVLNAGLPRYHETKLYVEKLPLQDFQGELRDIYTRAIPVDRLVSLKTAYPSPPLVTRLNSLKDLIVAARRLEVLHFEDRGQGTRFDFEPGERLPAFRELSLQSYDWTHDVDEVLQHWDFSRITALELISVPIYNFLSSVDFKDFVNLRTLHCEDFSAHHSQDMRMEGTQRLFLLIKMYIRALETIDITVHLQEFPIEVLLPHAPTLTTLRLRDHTGFDDELLRCPSMDPEHLYFLASHMPHLQVLELDMDFALVNPLRFLWAACLFPSLHTLTLHVQTLVSPYSPVDPGKDHDYDTAVWAFMFLVQNKAGSVRWQKLTINVGGWKKVLVRRLSRAWRALNEKGIFAERCFIMERGPEAPQLLLREECPIEASHHITPDTEEEEDEDEDDDDDDDDNEENGENDDYDDDGDNNGDIEIVDEH